MRTFRGGIRLYEGKELTENIAISPVKAGETVVLPLSQHRGAPANPIVKVGERVLRGQLIAESTSFVSAGICSSVSGTVKAIEHRPILGGEGMCVVIQNDGLYECAAGVGEPRDPDSLSAEVIRRIVAQAGIVGMGGAGFPTSVKLSPPNPDEVHHVIINGAEC